MLLFLGAGLFEAGVDKLIDKEVLPTIVDQVWNSSWLLDDSSPVGSLVATLTGYRAHPALMNLIAYAVYWAVVWLLMRRVNRRPAQQTAGRTA
jgi:high-affinity iron transporter